jgi:hypothetical protein
MDLIITSLYRNPQVFKNVKAMDSKNNWIGLNLISNNHACNRMAIGSKIIMTTSDKQGKEFTQFQESTLVNGFSAQHDPRIHFGIPFDQDIKKIQIKWCGQFEKNYESLKINQYQNIFLD